MMEAVRTVPRRIWRDGSPSVGHRSIPEETAVALTYNGGTYAVMMATPQDLEIWGEGRAVIGAGSPFPPILRNGKRVTVDQTNNAYVFPGIGLGVLAVRAGRVTDGMFVAAAKVLAEISPAARDARAPLLPSVAQLREVAFAVAKAVAREARAEGQCEPFHDEELDRLITRKMWNPVYRPYHRSPHPAR